MLRRLAGCGSALSLLFLGLVPSARALGTATVTIGMREVAPPPPALGVNEFGDSGGTQFSAGNLIPGWGFEPISIRHRYRVTNAGVENGHPWVELDGGGVTIWDLVTTGYLNGARYRLYRIVDAAGDPLPVAGGYLDLAAADHYAFVAEGTVPEAGSPGLPLGGWIDEDGVQRVYLEADAPLPERFDYIHFDLRTTAPDPVWAHARVHTGTINETWRDTWNRGATLQRVPHPEPVPAEFQNRGETCLRIDAPAGSLRLNGPAIFFPQDPNNGEADWYSVLEPGQTYRYEAWMRLEGAAPGTTVSLGFNAQYEAIVQAFAVDGQWALYGFEFTAPPAPTTGWHGSPAVTFTGPGTLYLDSIRLFRYDDPAQLDDWSVPSPLVFDRLMAAQPETGEKGMLRSMYVLLNKASMASNLSLQRDDGLTMDWYQAVNAAPVMTLPVFLEYARRTGETPETRMKPWLNVSSHADEEEWRMLVEYLGAPIDPDDPDDVAAKPWAYRRYQQRGVATPWTDEFTRIWIEFANETWHNGAVEDLWFGWGPTYGVHQGGREFGLYVNYVADLLRNQSPDFAALEAAGKLNLVMGSNYGNYAESGVPGSGGVAGVGHTTYVGPRWEVNETPNALFDDHGVQATLLGYVASLRDELDTYRRRREVLAAQGFPYQLLAYEGGPSGYTLPGTAPAAEVEIGEQYGKSQAMAVAALDAWLGAYEMGFTEQGFLGFAQGGFWSSHTPIVHGFRPHVAWLAQVMRNRYAGGRLLATDLLESPTIAWDGGEFPLVGAYAMLDGDRLSVFLLSRQLGGMQGGVDYGDGSTSVTLNLPAAPAGPATLYALAGDPRSNNRDSLAVQIESSAVVLGAQTVVTLPAGAIHLYVVDLAGVPAAAPLPPPASLVLEHRAEGNQLSWAAVPGATGYRLHRSFQPQFSRREEMDTIDVAGTSHLDLDGVGGSGFYYRVSTLNAWGQGVPNDIAVGGVNPFDPPYAGVTLLPAGAADGYVWLSWEPVSGASGYRVGIGSTSGGPYTWTDVGPSLGWLVEDAVNGAPLYWTVQPYGPSGRGPIAPEAIAWPVASGTETQLVAWEFAGAESYEVDPPASSRILPATVSTLGRGAGLVPGNVGYHPLDDSFGFMPNVGDANFGANPGGGSLGNAIARDLYVEFTLAPVQGQRLSLSALETGAWYPYIDAQLLLALRFRVGSGDWVDALEGPRMIARTSFTPTDVSFDLSGFSALQGLGETVTFRLYFYSEAVDARWGRAAIRRTGGADLVVRGAYLAETPDPSPFSLWQDAHFTAGERAVGFADADYDFDGDRLSNELEFFLGRDPKNAGDGDLSLTSAPAGGGSRLRFAVASAPAGTGRGVILDWADAPAGPFTAVAQSADGAAWTSLDSRCLVSLVPDSPGISELSLDLGDGLDPVFLRWRVEAPPGD